MSRFFAHKINQPTRSTTKADRVVVYRKCSQNTGVLIVGRHPESALPDLILCQEKTMAMYPRMSTSAEVNA